MSSASNRIVKDTFHNPVAAKCWGLRCNLPTRGLKLPVADTAGNLYLCMAACSIAFAITVAARIASYWSDVAGISKEVPMGNKMVHRKVVRSSFLEVIEGVGTAAIGGLLAA